MPVAINLSHFAPGLREAVVSLTVALRFIVFFACVTGLLLHLHRFRGGIEELAGPIVRAAVIVGLIATLPTWFAELEKLFLGIADLVNHGFLDHPMQTAAKLRATVADGNSEFSFRRVGESLYKAFLFGSAKLVVIVASLLQIPFMLLQYILKLLCFVFLPIALALFLVPSLTGHATRYLQQTLAVLAWPVGFAVTELVAYHLLTAYATNLAAAYDLVPGEIDAASFGSLIGGLLAALWLILGTIGTPFLMQALFCSGQPLGGGGRREMAMLQQLITTVKMIKTGGAGAAGQVASQKPSPAPSSSARGAPLSGLPPIASTSGHPGAAVFGRAPRPPSHTTI